MIDSTKRDPILRAGVAGLRPLASGGVEVASAYHQIVDYLRGALGPEAAALFAEPTPVDNGREIVWYAAQEGPAQRLVALAGPERAAAELALAEAVRRVDAHAQGLISGADPQGDGDDLRHMGQMLRLALQIPNEGHVWVVGGRPVLTFWGYLASDGDPQRSPVWRLLPAAAVGGGSSPNPGVPAPDPQPQRWIWALWALLAALLLAIAFLLWSACSIAWPGGASGAPRILVNFCPPAETASASNAEREALAAENARLREAWAQKAAVCRPEAAIPPAPPPAPGPEVQEARRLEPTPGPDLPPAAPPSADWADFTGCWRTNPGAVRHLDVETAQEMGKASHRFCIEDQGRSGSFRAEEEGGASCEGPVDLRADGALRFAFAPLACSDGGDLGGAEWTCRPEGEDALSCSAVTREAPQGVAVAPKIFRRQSAP